MGTERLAALRRALMAGPVTAAAAQVYADALEEAGIPFARFAQGRHDCTEGELPAELAHWLLGGRRGLTERLVLEHGVLRGVRFTRTPVSASGADRWRFAQEAQGFEVDPADLIDGYDQHSMEVVELLSSEACRGVTHVSGLIPETFDRLCEADLELRQVVVLEKGAPNWEQEFWWCETEVASEPPVGRLRIQELVLEPWVDSGRTVGWLLGSCRPVFDRLECLRAPGAWDACVEALVHGHAGALRHVEAGDWQATRDERGWHLVVRPPDDALVLVLYEAPSPDWDLDRKVQLIARVSGIVADVLVQGSELPAEQLRLLESAAGGKPIRFQLENEGETSTRAARGVAARRFDTAPGLRLDEDSVRRARETLPEAVPATVSPVAMVGLPHPTGGLTMKTSGTADVNGQRLYYEVRGSGPPVVLLMGIGYDSTMWGNQVPALAERFTCVALDNRDVGRSAKATSPYSIDDMADDVVGVLTHLDMRKAHVVGLSMGAMIAQSLAVRHPARVDRLVLTGAAAAPGRAAFDPISAWSWVKAHDRDGGIFATEQFVWLFSTAFLRNKSAVDATIAVLQGNPNPVTHEAYARQAAAYVKFDLLDRLGSVKAQTLVISGEQDLLTPPWLGRELAAAIPQARFELVSGDGASHVLPLERPKEFNELVMTFLSAP